MTTPWRRAQDRKRTLVAAASTAGIYVLAFVAIWAAGLLTGNRLSDRAGTIIVDLGGTDGAWGDIPLGLPNAPDRPADAEAGAAPLPAQATEEPPPPPAEEPAAKDAIPAPAPAKVAAIPKAAAPKPAAKTTQKTAPQSKKTIPEESTPEDSEPGPTADELAAQKAYEEAVAKADALARAASASRSSGSATTTKKFGTGTAGSPVASGGGTGSTPGVAGGTGTATFKGIEMGNALSTTFGASQGTVGRNLYVPIYYYMPLPDRVSDSVYQRIGTKSTFETLYQRSGSTWTLKSSVPLPSRGDYWRMLEDAGLDPTKADYKSGKKLKAITLEFAVGPVSRDGKNADLVDVRLVSSSGVKEIDEAVIYGFKQSAFFNKTGNAVSGKFVYAFD